MIQTTDVIDPPSRSHARLIRLGVRASLLLAVIGFAIPGRWGHDSAEAAIGLIIAVPLLRVALLSGRWARARDRRFALVGIGLLVIVAIGALIAACGGAK